mmetsp:Transcript_48412/g.147279  ORF Transcript_48412/g.147279 Transcript_48412/m.147279 type:complete len:189 (-) Transcript_48412:158-724(-)
MMVQGTSLTGPGMKGVLGTPGFTSPEYMGGEFCMGCTDVWAAGVVLYDLTFGHKSFSESFIHDKISLKEEVEAVTKKAREKEWRYKLAASPSDLEPVEWRKPVLKMLQWTLEVNATKRMANFDRVLEVARALAKDAAKHIGRNFEEWMTPPSRHIDWTCIKSLSQVHSVLGMLEKRSVADCSTWKFNY